MGLSMPGTLGADFDISCAFLKTSFFPCFSLSSLILAAVSLPLASVAEPVVTLPPEEALALLASSVSGGGGGATFFCQRQG